MDGVFEEMIGRRAFFDRVEVSLRNMIAKPHLKSAHVVENKPCKGKQGFYSRCAIGNLMSTGNPFKLLYGKTTRFQNVPDARLTFHSEKMPLTASQVLSVLHELSRTPAECRLTYAEMTFDFVGLTFEELRLQLFSPATRRLELRDKSGRRTLYAGRPTSDRQVRIYEKAKDLLRLELIFRRESLARMGIGLTHELLQINSTDMSRFVAFRMLNQHFVLDLIRESWKQRLWLHDFHTTRNYQELTDELQREYAVKRALMLEDSAINSLVAQMRAQLLW